MFVRASLYKRREENHLDATEWFIALIICWTCFGHLYAHHQKLEAIIVLLPRMVCNAQVAGGRLLGAEQQAMRPGWGKFTSSSRTLKYVFVSAPWLASVVWADSADIQTHTAFYCGLHFSTFV